MFHEWSVAAATAVVGYDLLSGIPEAQSSGALRIAVAGGLVGSAAAGDSAAEIRVGNQRHATLYNVTTGFVNYDRDRRPLGRVIIPPGDRLSVIVTDAPATNPLNGFVEVIEVPAAVVGR